MKNILCIEINENPKSEILSNLYLLNQSINYSYMNIDKVEKALIPPKDTQVNAEYLKNSLPNPSLLK